MAPRRRNLLAAGVRPSGRVKFGESPLLRVKQLLGKYRIDRRIADGRYAAVYKAFDTIAGIPVALKIPHAPFATKEALADFRQEVRLTAKLDHPNILPVKDAGFIDGTFVIAYPLGEQTLGDRLQRRLSARTIVDYAEQMLSAVAFAHRQRVMHCDIKPENFILFPENRLRLADFGIAKLARRTIEASGSGTVGYIAPEQAMGRPSFRSDVFSLGLILYRMYSACLPEWPFHWPPPGFDRVRRSVHPDVIAFLRRALEVDHRKRFRDGRQMWLAFRRMKARALRATPARRRRKNGGVGRDWRTIRRQAFQKQYRVLLELHSRCHRCGGPVSHAMQFCPFCATRRRVDAEEARFPSACPRCHRGLKSDWRFCPWCYGPAVRPQATPRYSDARYNARCGNPKCNGHWLMHFMRYCPWCRRKVRRPWKIRGERATCAKCRWGILPDYWDHCPWCSSPVSRR